MKQGMFLPPDFAIVGTPYNDGVMLIASTQIIRASLEVDDRPHDSFLFDPAWMPSTPDITLNANLRRVTMVIASTYDEAFQKLMGTWQPPEHAGRQAIDRGQAAIESPRYDVHDT